MMVTKKMIQLLLSLTMTLLILLVDTNYNVNAQSNEFAPLLEDNVSIRTDVPGRDDARVSFTDSYSDGDSCYCSTTFDHEIGDVVVNTPLGILTVRQVCEILGDGPRGREGRPLYNDIQCGNGPPNNVGDENDCPGRVEYGIEGCGYIGPMWNFTAFTASERPTRSPVELPPSVLNPPISPSKVPVSSKAPVSKAPIATTTKAPASKVPVTKAPTATTTTKQPTSTVPTKAVDSSEPTITPVKVATQAPVSKLPKTTTPTILPETEMPTQPIIPSEPTDMPMLKTTVPTTKTPVSVATPSKAPRMVRTETPTKIARTSTPTSNLPTTSPLQNVPVPVVVSRVPTRTPIRRRPRARILNMTVYDTTTKPATPIRNLDRQGTIFDLAVVGTKLTIAAEVDSDVDNIYIKYAFDDSFTNVEVIPYFTLNGNSGTEFNKFRPLARVGMHTIVASLFNGDTDSLLDTVTFDVTIIDSSDSFTGPFAGFNLIDVSTQTQRTIPRIIDLDEVGTSLSINAMTETSDNGDAIDRVMFYFDDCFVRTEKNEPWTLGSNNRTLFRPTPFLTISGLHTVVAVALSSDEDVLGSSSVTFRVIGTMSSRPPTLPPVSVPIGRTDKPSISMVPSSTGVPSLNEVPSQTSVPSLVEQTLMPTDFIFPTNIPDDPTFVPSEIASPNPTSSRVPNNFDTEEPTIESSGLTRMPSLSNGPGRTNVPSMVEQTLIPTDLILPTNIPDDPTFMPSELASPTSTSSQLPNNFDTEEPTIEPSGLPPPSLLSPQPTSLEFETELPTSEPASFISIIPTQIDTVEPTPQPTSESTIVSTSEPTKAQAVEPTADLMQPTKAPISEPTGVITIEPMSSPTVVPTLKPIALATDEPTISPSTLPETSVPTVAPKEPDPTPPKTKIPTLRPVAIRVPTITRTPPLPTSGSAVISGELRKWHKVTLTFTGPLASETDAEINPFMDYRLDVAFTHRSTKSQYNVPGFFAADGDAAETSSFSGNKWQCHFAPDAIGFWDYSVTFVTGKNVAVNGGGSKTLFNGLTGSFNVIASDKTGRDHRGKGRLQYVGQHHLQFAEGEYFLKAGADSPENFLAYEDFDNTPNVGNRRKSWSPHENDFRPGDPTWQNGKGTGIIGAINYLSNEGMNVFSFLTMNINGDDKNVFPYLSDSREDRLRMDVSKLAQWEIVFEHADTMGMYLHFKTAETENDDLLDDGLLGNERKLYYRELIARFGHHLALNWNLAEEISNPVEQIEEFANYFKDLDPYKHVVLFHTGSNSVLYSEFLGYPSIDGASLQNKPSLVFSATLRWVTQSAATGRKWIVANDEQNSAFNGVVPDSEDPDHDIVRQDALWGNIMAGGAGVEYYFGYGFDNSDLTCEDFRSRANMWKQSRHALDFFRVNEIKFWEMTNDNSRLPDDSVDYVLSSSDGETIVVYRKSTDGTQIDVQGLSGTYRVQWYNPREGGSLQTGTVPSIVVGGVGNQRNFGSALESNDKDWVVLLTKQ